MKKTILFLLFLCPIFVVADDLQDILTGKYKPVLIPVEKQDSILAAAVVENSKSSKNEAKDQPSVVKRWKLEYENKKPIYRHSFMADYYVVDTQKGTRTQIGGGPVRDAKMSPNGRYVVYSKENNLYIFKLDYMTEVAITTNNGARTMVGGNGTFKEYFIYNGISDWLYEEEFGVTSLFEFSPDSKQIAFVRLNETEVPSFSWLDYLTVDYPAAQTIRYPRSGTANPQASVCVYDIHYKSTNIMTLETENAYIPRLKWTNPIDDPKAPVEAKLIAEKINRDQNKMEVYAITPKSTASWLIYKESSDQFFINYALFDQWKWLKDNSMIVLSEKDGWQSAYLYSPQGQEIKRLTPDGIDVTAIYGVDEKNDLLYYQAAPSALVRYVYAYDIKKGEISKLTSKEGIHKMRFSEDYTYAIDDFENCETPNLYTFYEIKKGELRILSELQNNDSILNLWKESGLPDKQYLSVFTGSDDSLNAWMILPPSMDSDPTKKYPCVLMQYSGPASQQVLNRWRKGFGHYLASQGYVVINTDGHGTNCRGRAWRNASYMNLGEIEAKDQLATAKYAASLSFVDPERIAIMGWSYGGYQAIRTLCEQGVTAMIKCAVAIAPVTDWRMYDSGYTERFMRRPQVNEKGYDAADLTKMADRMNGKLLLVHGLSDDNVHAQHTLKLIDALVQAGKQFDMQIYPDDNHFLRKRSNYEHLHRRIMLFFETNL